MPVEIKQLQEYPCFRGLAEDQLKAIVPLTDVISYPPGQILFNEGEPGDFIYFLTKGEVHFFYNIGEGGQVHVDQVYTKEFIGCSALIPPYTHTATAQSQTEIEALKIDAEALRSLMIEDYRLGFTIQQNIIQMLMDRITSFRLGF